MLVFSLARGAWRLRLFSPPPHLPPHRLSSRTSRAHPSRWVRPCARKQACPGGCRGGRGAGPLARGARVSFACWSAAMIAKRLLAVGFPRGPTIRIRLFSGIWVCLLSALKPTVALMQSRRMIRPGATSPSRNDCSASMRRAGPKTILASWTPSRPFTSGLRPAWPPIAGLWRRRVCPGRQTTRRRGVGRRCSRTGAWRA
jgi:hypothetical protein